MVQERTLEYFWYDMVKNGGRGVQRRACIRKAASSCCMATVHATAADTASRCARRSRRRHAPRRSPWPRYSLGIGAPILMALAAGGMPMTGLDFLTQRAGVARPIADQLWSHRATRRALPR